MARSLVLGSVVIQSFQHEKTLKVDLITDVTSFKRRPDGRVFTAEMLKFWPSKVSIRTFLMHTFDVDYNCIHTVTSAL